MSCFLPLAVSISVSVWTLVAISLERYYAICQPLRSRGWQTLSHAYKIISIVWLLSLVAMAPIAALSKLLPIGSTSELNGILCVALCTVFATFF